MTYLMRIFLSVPVIAACACPAAFASGAREDLKGDLLRATIKAIDLEISATKAKLEAALGGTGPAENVAMFRTRISGLESERAGFAGMTPEQYPAPEAAPSGIPEAGPVLPPLIVEADVTVEAPCSDGSLLTVQGGTRSGPFYHLAGIKGGDYGVLKPGKAYKVELCLVYRREYFGFIGDYYVYVRSVK